MKRVFAFLLVFVMAIGCSYAELTMDNLDNLMDSLGYVRDPQFELGGYIVTLSGVYRSIEQTETTIESNDGAVNLTLYDMESFGITKEEEMLLISLDQDTYTLVMTEFLVERMENTGLADIDSGSTKNNIPYVIGYRDFDGGRYGLAFAFNGTELLTAMSVVSKGEAEAMEMSLKKTCEWKMEQLLNGIQIKE